MDWLEIVLGFDCNCRCRVCPSGEQPRGFMPLEEAERLCLWGRERGATGLWLGGGEPTLYPHLFDLVTLARRLGYERIRLQTNGLMLAYEKFAERLAGAGVDTVAFSLKGAGADSHDWVTRRPGGFELVTKGVRNAGKHLDRIEADVLVTSRCLPELDSLVAGFAGLGVAEFVLWWPSTHGLSDKVSATRLVPRFSEGADALSRAFDAADVAGVGMTSLHTPPCALPEGIRDRYRPSSFWNLYVATPGGEPFRAEESPMEGGVFLQGCSACSHRRSCLGLRRDYLDAFGADEFRPL